MPEIAVDGQNLEVVEEFNLLGVIITSDLKWEANTDYISLQAYKRLWMIRRLKNLGLNTRSLVKIFTTQIRSVLDYGSVTWHALKQPSTQSTAPGSANLLQENKVRET